MENEQTSGTNGNGTTAAVKQPTVLDSSKAIFAARKSAAKSEEVLKALKEYMGIQSELDKLAEQAEALKIKRTAATQKLVELRGMGRINTESRGVGNLMGRSDSAWISFIGATESELLKA